MKYCNKRIRGVAMAYVVIGMPVFLGFCGLAVDVARMQVAKTEAQTVADAAARYAAVGLATSYTPILTARANAIAVAAQATVDGGAPTITSADVVQGSWNATTHVFTADSTGTVAKVTVRQTFTRAGAAPLMLGIFSRNKVMKVTAVAIAQCTASASTILPPASGNLWLSGMPNNTTTQNLRPDNSTVWDNSGTSATGTTAKQRPLVVTLSSLGLAAGDTIRLEGVSGTGSWDGTSTTSNAADGDETFIVANGETYPPNVPTTSNNGISNVRAPIGAVMGVFLDGNAPNTTAAPAALDYATDTQRDYTNVAPRLKQTFFIGDGKRDNGEGQTVTIPTGATRLFLGMMDAWQWNDNTGTFTTNLYGDNAITLVD